MVRVMVPDTQRVIGLLLAAALASAACGPSNSESVRAGLEAVDIGLGEPSAEARHDLYLRLCGSCHGQEGRGDGAVAPDLRVPPTDLTQLAASHAGEFPRGLVEDSLTGRRAIRAHGPPEMPVWAERLAPSESPAAAAAGLHRARLLAALVDHVESLQRSR